MEAVSPPWTNDYTGDAWFQGTLSEACDLALVRARAIGRPQKVKLLVHPLGRFWVISDTGLRVAY